MTEAKRLLPGAGLVLAGVTLSGEAAFAADDLGIAEAGETFSLAIAALGAFMAVAGVAIAGFLMATNFFLALTVGGPLMVGGTFMVLAQDVTDGLWGGGTGGGSVERVVAAAEQGSTAFAYQPGR